MKLAPINFIWSENFLNDLLKLIHMPTFFLLDCKVNKFSRVRETSENWRGINAHRYKIMHTISGSSQMT